ncbi:membrane protein [gut metagenome]|uniref:Membrane protein n=1 Tax=gut metagenome TaxID=749906 RepID=J9GGJ7_9ZZZZ
MFQYLIRLLYKAAYLLSLAKIGFILRKCSFSVLFYLFHAVSSVIGPVGLRWLFRDFSYLCSVITRFPFGGGMGTCLGCPLKIHLFSTDWLFSASISVFS